MFRLDRERIVAALRERAQGMLEARGDVLEVRLFGSLARGCATPGSDADLWILVRDGARPFIERGAELSRFFEGVGVGCDTLAYTESEWASMRSEGRRIVRVVDGEGIPLACRGA